MNETVQFEAFMTAYQDMVFSTAMRLLDEGATVIVTGRSAEGIESAEKVLEGRAKVVRSDAADPGQVQDVIASIVNEHGRLDALFL